MGKFQDLTGMKFGRLLVLERTDDYVTPKGYTQVRWNCICDCGKIVKVCTKSLKSANSKSCGCLNKEINAKRLSQQRKKFNKYKIYNDYIVMFTSKNEPFYIDKEDFDKVKDICWFKHRTEKYLVGKQNGRCVRLHDLIMGIESGNSQIVVDHIGGNDTRYDNRKCNLRIVNQSQNAMNRKIRVDNNSGYTGICWNSQHKRWIVHIQNKYLGSFKDISQAIKVRKEAEQNFYGKYSYENSQKISEQYKVVEQDDD